MRLVTERIIFGDDESDCLMSGSIYTHRSKIGVNHEVCTHVIIAKSLWSIN